MRAAIGVTLIGSGAMLIYAGFKNKSIWTELLSVIRS